MPTKRDSSLSTTLLAVAVGLFLLLSGVQTLVDLNSDGAKFLQGLGQAFGANQTGHWIAVTFAIVKVIAGAILIIGPFGLLAPSLRALAFWLIIAFWALVTIVASFGSGPLFKPTPMVWIQGLSLNVAILAALWQLKPKS